MKLTFHGLAADQELALLGGQFRMESKGLLSVSFAAHRAQKDENQRDDGRKATPTAPSYDSRFTAMSTSAAHCPRFYQAPGRSQAPRSSDTQSFDCKDMTSAAGGVRSTRDKFCSCSKSTS